MFYYRTQRRVVNLQSSNSISYTSMIDQEKLEARWALLEAEGPITVGVTSEFNPLKNPPDWYDAQRFRNAQILAKKYYLSLNIAHFIGNILLVHLPDVLIPVLATGHSASPYMVFMRILSTVVHILSWYEEDPFDTSTKTHKSLLTVRRNCHMAVTKMMNSKYPRDDRLWLSQFDMSMTQWSLIGLVAIRPAECGFHGTTKEEFEEYFYFWKVMGYCVGIQDRFNICLDNYDESVEYMDMCFQRCYKIHLDRQCLAVKVGMDLTEGVFLGINGITPKWIICFESFMKFWYDSLGVRHPIRLDSWDTKLSYRLWNFLIYYVLRIRLIYGLFTWFYLFMLKRLFRQADYVHDFLEQKYGNVVYQLRSDYHLDANNNNNDIDYMDEEKTTSLSTLNFYQIDNYLYKPNV